MTAYDYDPETQRYSLRPDTVDALLVMRDELDRAQGLIVPDTVFPDIAALGPQQNAPVSAIGGIKHDAGKPRLSLIPRAALEAEARVMGFGANKYGTFNWKKGLAYSRLLDAALRHVHAFVDGENDDPESGLNHLAHARANLAMLLDQLHSGAGEDDRYKADAGSANR